MFGSEIIDTAIGIVFTFLLVSVLVTVVNELIAALFLSRAKWLQFGIGRLIGPEWATRFYAHPLIEATGASGKPITIGDARTWRGGGPSYVPARSFSNVLVHLVVESDAWLPPFASAVHAAVDSAPPDADLDAIVQRIEDAAATLPDPTSYRPIINDLALALRARDPSTSTLRQAMVDIDAFLEAMPMTYLAQVIDQLPERDKIKKTLRLLIHEARLDLDRFRENVELWFDNAMDRVSGWYKRRAQWVVFSLGLLAAIGLNVDPLAIGDYLQTHAGVRDAVVAKAKAYAAVTPATAGGNDAAASASANEVKFASTLREIDGLGLPIGWTVAARANVASVTHVAQGHWLGWLLTAFAATLGAPFWFDLLNRIVTIRSAGKAPEEAPRAPKQQPTPLGPGEEPGAANFAAAVARRSA